MLDNQFQHEDVPSVVVDNYQGGYEATKHLINLGHTQIAFIGGPSVFLSVAERKRGYSQALEEAGLTSFGTDSCGFTVSGGYEVAKRWVREDKLPTAFFCGDDFIALGVVQALRDEGIRVPHDLSVVGFDDQQFAGEFYPRLTTVRQPEAQMGSIGVDLLMQLIHGEVMPPAVTKLAPQLLVRESSANVRLT
ncbi:LacI family DNA-binding transcriptional regulator [Paenibacillus rhizoplanae]